MLQVGLPTLAHSVYGEDGTVLNGVTNSNSVSCCHCTTPFRTVLATNGHVDKIIPVLKQSDITRPPGVQRVKICSITSEYGIGYDAVAYFNWQKTSEYCGEMPAASMTVTEKISVEFGCK